MTTTEQFSLRWNNFHSNLTSGFHELFQGSEMVDVTLAVEGQFFQAHKIVLSICSPYFKQMFKVNPCKHPIVILKDVAHDNMKDILEFMYMGEVNVLRENLSAFLRTAELLQVKGLTGDDSSETSSRRDDKSESFCENDDDLTDLTFSHMIDSEMDLPNDYSTSRVQTPPVCNSSLLHHQSPTQNCKRPPPKHGSQATNNNCKRTKTDSNQNKSNNRNNNEQHEQQSIKPEQLDNMEQADVNCGGSDKLSTIREAEDTKDCNIYSRQNFESNATSTATEQGTTEQDVLLYAADQKHVYCPYCCRKFVNRYNLKVHIRDKHDDSPIALDCVICGKVMRNRSCLRVHMYHHRKQQLETAAAADQGKEVAGFPVNVLL